MDSLANPVQIGRRVQRAVHLHQAGNLAGAESLYRTVLALQPDHGDAANLLGVVACHRVAVALQPGHAAALTNLGLVLAELGRPDAAARMYRAAIALRPDHAPTRSNLGVVLTRQGRWSDAVNVYRTAITLGPDHADLYANLGNALTEERKADEAVAVLRRGTALRPDHTGARFNLGIARQEQGDLRAAAGLFRSVVALYPDHSDAHTRLAGALKAQGRLDEAVAVYDTMITLRPDDADARWNRSLTLLLGGDFARGWEDYEWRWLTREKGGERHAFTQPLWSGEDLGGRTILLHAEQGLGDTIQFVRYVPAVVRRGGRVLLRVPAVLTRLLGAMPGVTLLTRGDPVPEFDVHCPLLSLPRAFGTTLETIPAEVPYLFPDPALVVAWRRRLQPYGGLRVGIVWAGNPAFAEDRARSPGVEPFRRLFAVDNVHIFALQKGAGRTALRAAGAQVTDLGGDIGDFADTAAIMANLDLVVSSCTAPIHLAGALGIPGWLALKAVPDWRWLMGRDDSPWYPTLRLFRQTVPGDWDGVFARIAAELADAAHLHGHGIRS